MLIMIRSSAIEVAVFVLSIVNQLSSYPLTPGCNNYVNGTQNVYIMSDKREVANGNRGMYSNNAEVFGEKLFSGVVDNAKEFQNTGEMCLKKEYVLYKPKVTWDTAMYHCLHNGRQLATIKSQYENHIFRDLFSKPNMTSMFIWVAGMGLQSKANAIWLPKGDKLSFSNWDPARPIASDGYYCLMVQKGGLWHGISCTLKFSFACETMVPC